MTSARLLRGAIGAAGFLVLGELVIRFGIGDQLDFPAPSTILIEAGRLLADPEFLAGVGTTLTNWVLGLLLATVIAVPVGVLLGALTPLESAIRPVLEFMRPIPSVAIIPLAILLIPVDELMKISVIVYASVWPILINTLYGMHDVDPLAKESLRSFGFGRLAVLARVSLPSAAPFVATGIRIAAGIALVLAVSAELLAGGFNGIGVYVAVAGSGNRTDLMMAATFWAGVIGVLANVLLLAGERRLFHWHRMRTGAADS
ncbi:NitT/TauT family transport system permease protein [Nonomuraea thailandensis]|uniref:NitT/TauT family transport system permease protein n=1 Tax=Nonomuraea thailandensis TaxID=1188745 RepID=A0A9X2K8W3_9ACTN|nr:ABC transporter permease [Nonomuraea thailandensis]MCP2361211.1 NitT/TauT family transport system permease protein [Nonomuraea thailandensis]